jgi:tripartite-type tricarboxylate transporter receptor subunit TctC
MPCAQATQAAAAHVVESIRRDFNQRTVRNETPMKHKARKRLWTALLPLFAPAIALAQAPYPTKPVRFISPYAPGGSTSAVARFLGQKLTEIWGQNVIIDNRPGGNTIIGTDALAKSTPDGHTIIMTTNTHLITPSLLPKLPYDPIKDFAPVNTVYSSEFVLVVNPAVPAQNLQELIALAKAKPGQLYYATTGAGESGHLANEMLGIRAGIKTRHIPQSRA